MKMAFGGSPCTVMLSFSCTFCSRFFLSVSFPALAYAPLTTRFEFSRNRYRIFGCFVQKHDAVYNLTCADWQISGADRKRKHLIAETGTSLYRTRTAPQFIASLHEMLPPRFHSAANPFRLKRLKHHQPNSEPGHRSTPTAQQPPTFYRSSRTIWLSRLWLETPFSKYSCSLGS